jgi:1-aminocyclopropane-1-carboxylate deaminase/D-cysteine desulfhydrase-like pyridoxal-dependent ACC family enzyme
VFLGIEKRESFLNKMIKNGNKWKKLYFLFSYLH